MMGFENNAVVRSVGVYQEVQTVVLYNSRDTEVLNRARAVRYSV